MMQAPLTPVLAPTMISQAETTVTVELPEVTGTATGGSPITSYHLVYSSGTSYISITGENPNNLLFVVTKGGLNTNIVYKFKYRVRNKFGWSLDYSPDMSIRTATFPSKIATVSFQLVDQTKVRVSWLPPYNGGSPISEYYIEFRHNYDEDAGLDPVYSELPDCLGDSYTILTQRYCEMSMSIFKEDPLNLDFKDLIVVRISATNQIGASTFSDGNTSGITV